MCMTMRRARDQALRPGHFIKTSSAAGSAWGEVQRIQDGMVLVREEGSGQAAWFQLGAVREFYEREDKHQCLRVDHQQNARLQASRVAIRGGESVSVTGQASLDLQAPSLQISAQQMDLVSNRLAVQAGEISARCGQTCAIQVDSSAATLQVPVCSVLGDLQVRGISFLDAIMRIDRDLADIRSRLERLEAGAPASTVSRTPTPGAPRPEPGSPPRGGTPAAAAAGSCGAGGPTTPPRASPRTSPRG